MACITDYCTSKNSEKLLPDWWAHQVCGMENCLFCKVLRKEIPATIVHEGESFLAFRDIHPQAPEHILVIPRRHIKSLAEADDPEYLGQIMAGVRETAAKAGMNDEGYRVVANIGKLGGQTVDHLHFHILSGRRLKWPPG